MGGEGGTTCASAPVPTSGPAPTTIFPDGNPSCANLSLAGPTTTEKGFQLVATNTGTAPCDISGMAKVAFLDAAGNVINIDFRVSSEPASGIALAPGASAVYDFDVGPGQCQAAAVMLFVNEAGSRQLGAPASVCPPVVENPAKLAA
jgi:hypothetical protein